MRAASIFVCIVFAAILAGHASAAEEADLNSFMIQSYRMLADPANGRRANGYDLGSYFTRNLNYGKENGVIRSQGAPRTMCNAAVTETIIEAINLYAASNANWSPKDAIPTDLWNRGGFSGLKAHFFSHSLLDYPPLKGIPKSQIPPSLKTDIQKFHSEEAMAKAIEKLGIGQRVQFRNAKPGDIISFDRTNDTIGGGFKYAGHSVVFLGYLDRNQEPVTSFDEAKVVGFKYFSSQGSGTTAGLGERWAYFRGFCPVRPGYGLPSDGKAGCGDRVDTAANRAKSGLEKANRPTDCCLNKASSPYGARVGRLASPGRWTFSASHAALTREYEQLQIRIKEFVRNRERASVRVALIASGATRLESINPAKAAPFIGKVKDSFGIDLRAVARSGESPSISPAIANQITRATPKAVINSANRTVTVDVRNALKSSIDNAELAAIARLREAEANGIPNIRLDQIE